MRLWHQDMIPKLPREQLLGQHRECCALRGKGWLKNHSTIQYIFNYSRYHLFKYHELVINEMENRGYKVSEEWKNKDYCGINLGYLDIEVINTNKIIYKEHNDNYYIECLNNLKEKGIILS